MQKDHDLTMENVRVLADAVSKAIGENKAEQRFIDVTKIPLICLSITGIHENLKELKEMMKEMQATFVRKEEIMPIRYVCYGLVGMVMTGFIGSLLTIVFHK
jgi:hypothetical protein